MSRVELMGANEIAEAMGVSRTLVFRWIARGDLPEPVAELRMGRVWLAEDIREWMRTRVADRRRRQVI